MRILNKSWKNPFCYSCQDLNWDRKWTPDKILHSRFRKTSDQKLEEILKRILFNDQTSYKQELLGCKTGSFKGFSKQWMGLRLGCQRIWYEIDQMEFIYIRNQVMWNPFSISIQHKTDSLFHKKTSVQTDVKSTGCNSARNYYLNSISDLMRLKSVSLSY